MCMQSTLFDTRFVDGRSRDIRVHEGRHVTQKTIFASAEIYQNTQLLHIKNPHTPLTI